MKYCLNCSYPYPVSKRSCPRCLMEPARKDGFLTYAPELEKKLEGFNPEFFTTLSKIENKHFWFGARNKLITWAIKKYMPGTQSLLEVGCGTGYVLQNLYQSIPQLHLAGSELYITGLKFAAAQLPDVDFWQMDAKRIPFREEFDIIAACDVLEHIKEDQEAVAEMASALVPGGFLLITVPQHPFLWSASDEDACHIRRYTSSDLSKKIEATGLEILTKTSFVTLLFPLIIGKRMIQKSILHDTGLYSELNIPTWQNWFFDKCMALERVFIYAGLRFPFGSSLMVVAKKK